MQPKKTPKRIANPVFRRLTRIVGYISVVLGIAGLFLPLLPTTPFLLLAASCFLRSSPKAYQRLTNHPLLGKYISNYMAGKGITLKTKITSVTMLWCAIGASLYALSPNIWIYLPLLVIASCVTIYLLRLPTLRLENNNIEEKHC